ncbi:MAG: polyphosphate kinase, partial [Blastochloris sp.]|nr:polyphosphate kinase [Blastochloris sp.]
MMQIVEPPLPTLNAESYINRELSWLEFNQRVLEQAMDTRVPLIERIKFLAIVSSNTDEFFMVRVAAVHDRLKRTTQSSRPDGIPYDVLLLQIRDRVLDITKQQRELMRDLLAQLADDGVIIHTWGDLPDAWRAAVSAHFLEEVFPLLTPLAVDHARPFPFISNLSLNLLVTLRFPLEAQLTLARVKVPVGGGVPRFIRIGARNHFVLLEDVMSHSLQELFPGMEVASVELFRVTRNANTERGEEGADDLVSMIEAELRDRKFAPIVRLEVQAGIVAHHRGMLAAELGLDEELDVYESDVMSGMRDLWELVKLDIAELHDKPFHPIDNVKLQDRDSIFHLIRENGPILLHHPYESFATSVVRFVREAAEDPKVLAIKMTLYRTSADTMITDHLIEAAENGKQVAVVVELKARFDEAANLRWAGRLEEAGHHRTYGVIGP